MAAVGRLLGLAGRSGAPGGHHLVAKAVRKPNLSGSWALLGRSWWLLGRSEDLLGRSLALRGRSWSAFWLPGELFLERVGLFLWAPLAKSRKPPNSLTIQHFMLFFMVPRVPKSVQNCSKINLSARNSIWTARKWPWTAKKSTWTAKKYAWTAQKRPGELSRQVGTQRNSRKSSQVRSKYRLSVRTWISTP